jgi:hypothetical protein
LIGLATMTHPAALPLETLLTECRVHFKRASGPGGQNRNKVETGVTLEHLPTGLKGEAVERRSQAQNRAMAAFRLRLELAIRVRAEPGGEPSELWRSRCRGGRLAINPEHDDFPAILAEALDTLAASSSWDVKESAARLGLSATQLVKLLAAEPRALALLNAERGKMGMHPLR